MEIPNPFVDEVKVYALGAGNTLTTRNITAGGYSTVSPAIYVTEDIAIKLSVLQSQRYNSIPIYRSKLGEYLDRANDYAAIQAIDGVIGTAVADVGSTRTIAADFTWDSFKLAARYIQDYSFPVTILGTLKNVFKIAEWVDSNNKRVLTYETIENLVKSGGQIPVMGATYHVLRGTVKVGGVTKTIIDDQTVYILGEKEKVGQWTNRTLSGTGQVRSTVIVPWTAAPNIANAVLESHMAAIEDRAVDVYSAYCCVKIAIPAGS